MDNKNIGIIQTERIRALLKYEKPDRVPLWPFFDMTGFAAIYNNRPIIDAYRDPKISLDMQRKVCEDFGWICSPLFFRGFGVTDFGGEIKLPESEFSQSISTTRFAIESEDDFDKIKIPDIPNSEGILRQTEFYKMVDEKKFDNEPFRMLLLMFAANPYELAGSICRPEMLARWLIRKPDLVHRLLQFCSDVLDELIDYWYNVFGTDNIVLLSGGVRCSNQIISPKHFEQFVFPYLKAGHEKVLSRGYERFYCHICGEHNMNMPFWEQVPMGSPGIVSIGHEVELKTAAHYFPNDIILGNLEPAILQSGTPDEVYDTTGTVIKQGKELPGGFIFSMGCQFPPRAPLENVTAMNKAVHDFGRYE